MNKKGDTEFHFEFAAPLVCTAIHNGNSVNPQVHENLGISEDVRLREEDPFTAYFTRIASNRIIQKKSRFEYDLNRPRHKSFYLAPSDAWGLNVRKTEPDGQLIEKCRSDYDLFYRRVKKFFDEMLETFGTLFVYDIHSYNHHRQGADKPFDSPEMNPEIILGSSNMPEKWQPLIGQIRDILLNYDFMGRELDVRIDVRFPGGYFPRWIHNTYPEKSFCLAIEFKKIFMDEWTGEIYPEVLRELRKALNSTKIVITDFLGR